MTDKSPSDGFTLEELRSEFDWMFEFQSRMAEYIRNDPDVHSLAGYVSKLESENAQLCQQLADVTESMGRVEERCAKLRELVRAAWKCAHAGPSCYDCRLVAGGCTLKSAMRELGVEP